MKSRFFMIISVLTFTVVGLLSDLYGMIGYSIFSPLSNKGAAFAQEKGTSRVVFKVKCYDEGKAALQGLNGIKKIETGFHYIHETDTVYFDPMKITIKEMEAALKKEGTYVETIQEREELNMFEKFMIATLLFLPLMVTQAAAGSTQHNETAVFAGGCFWCMTPPFEKLNGVTEVVSGYTGGTGPNPTYEDYAAKGHIEAVKVTYDPSRISYSKLLDVFWRQIDPTDQGGQFCDRGPQYRSAIFYENNEQKQSAEKSKEALEKSGRYQKPIVTELIKASQFYKAEDYHQDYYKKNPIRYKFYRYNCGRDQYLEKVWGKEKTMHDPMVKDASDSFVKPSKEELRKRLTPVQFKVSQQEGTEPPFNNEYWDNHKPGIYVDVVSGEPLFSSLDKYDSGTGWPSFTKPLEPGNIVTKEDRTWYLAVRTEVRSKHADSHLGHVFDDGPAPTNLRYCMNSASLKFIPAEDLMKTGYGKYARLFEKH